MLEQAAIERTAQRLAEAYTSRQPLPGHEALGDEAPVETADAYAIQRRMRELAGIVPGAWKAGATSEAAQSLLGVGGPFLGAVGRDRIVPTGTVFVIAEWFVGNPAIEIEVGLRPLRDLTELPADPMELADAVQVVPCIEVVDSRLGAVIGPPGPCLVADNGVASALVVGEPLDLDAAAVRALGDLPVRLAIAGRDPVDGAASMALGHPLNALHAMASLAIENGAVIAAGQTVSTGTCTGLTPVEAGVSVVGTVGTAQIEASFR